MEQHSLNYHWLKFYSCHATSFIHAATIVVILFLQAGDREMLWVLRISVTVIATLGAIIALTVGSVYYLS
jgi:hypothetical protein